MGEGFNKYYTAGEEGDDHLGDVWQRAVHVVELTMREGGSLHTDESTSNWGGKGGGGGARSLMHEEFLSNGLGYKSACLLLRCCSTQPVPAGMLKEMAV